MFKFLPPFTNPDAASAIVFVGSIVWVFAALTHGTPNLINRRAMMPWSAAVSVNDWWLPSDTSARAGVSGSQVIAFDCGLRAAITATEPNQLFQFCTALLFQNHEATEALAGQIDLLHGSLRL